jgi:hypothetical protein
VCHFTCGTYMKRSGLGTLVSEQLAYQAVKDGAVSVKARRHTTDLPPIHRCRSIRDIMTS